MNNRRNCNSKAVVYNFHVHTVYYTLYYTVSVSSSVTFLLIDNYCLMLSSRPTLNLLPDKTKHKTQKAEYCGEQVAVLFRVELRFIVIIYIHLFRILFCAFVV